MKTLNPEQVGLVYRALTAYAQKQETILQQHSFDSDVESQVNESRTILNEIQNIAPEFLTSDSVYLVSSFKMHRIEEAIKRAEEIESDIQNYATNVVSMGAITGRLSGIIALIKMYLF